MADTLDVQTLPAADQTAGYTGSRYSEVVAAIRALDKAVNKGVIHRNNAARRKSRLMKKLNRATGVGKAAAT